MQLCLTCSRRECPTVSILVTSARKARAVVSSRGGFLCASDGYTHLGPFFVRVLRAVGGWLAACPRLVARGFPLLLHVPVASRHACVWRVHRIVGLVWVLRTLLWRSEDKPQDTSVGQDKTSSRTGTISRTCRYDALTAHLNSSQVVSAAAAPARV